jgi:hypothetical protein
MVPKLLSISGEAHLKSCSATQTSSVMFQTSLARSHRNGKWFRREVWSRDKETRQTCQEAWRVLSLFRISSHHITHNKSSVHHRMTAGTNRAHQQQAAVQELCIVSRQAHKNHAGRCSLVVSCYGVLIVKSLPVRCLFRFSPPDRASRHLAALRL